MKNASQCHPASALQ